MMQLAKNVVLTLMLSQCQLSFWQLKQDMLVRFKQDVTLNMCRNELRDYVEVCSYFPLYINYLFIFLDD
jgi:hypothetical protein